jgi:methyltransferase (TIGR00027 family)
VVVKEVLMASIENVTGTAFVVAEFRAEENVEPTPLYRDSIVGLFLNEETRQAAGRVAASFPPVKDLVKLRTKYLDDMLEKLLGASVRQVVILGAGLDTRAVRKRAPGVTYFEIDDTSTLEVKRACYAREGIEADLKLIPGNYVTDGMFDLLAGHGFDPGLPTYFIWEGNTMYLPMDGVKQILKELRTRMRWFRLSFDYMAESVIARTTGDPGITSLVDSFARMGAPWRSGIRDIRTLAHELRLNVIENFRTADLHLNYWRGRPMRSPIFNFYSVCTLGGDSLPGVNW